MNLLIRSAQAQPVGKLIAFKRAPKQSLQAKIADPWQRLLGSIFYTGTLLGLCFACALFVSLIFLRCAAQTTLLAAQSNPQAGGFGLTLELIELEWIE
ncbi:MAG: hypothetical protein V4623_04530 [Pseudomonadota bacterium]